MNSDIEGGSYGGILIPCNLLPFPTDISWSPPFLSTFHLISAGEGRSHCLSYCPFRPLLGPIPIMFSYPHYLKLMIFFSVTGFNLFPFYNLWVEITRLDSYFEIFMLFDLEIFKNVFEFLFSRNILKRFSIFEFQEVSSLCEPWKKDMSFFCKMVIFFFSK